MEPVILDRAARETSPPVLTSPQIPHMPLFKAPAAANLGAPDNPLNTPLFLRKFMHAPREKRNDLDRCGRRRDEHVVRRNFVPPRLQVERLGGDHQFVAAVPEVKRVGGVVLREAESEQAPTVGKG